MTHSAIHAPRVLLYSHDTFGLGHFRRCLKIAQHVSAASPDASILILSGSPMAGHFPLPRHTDVVKMPSVVKTGRGQYESRSLSVPIDDAIGMRRGIIAAVAARFQPDVFLVDHAPLGLHGEVLSVLRDLRVRHCSTRLVLGLRDIIDEPERVVETWKETGVYDVLEELYDRIFIYGTRKVYDAAEAYRLPPSVREKSSYVGFICSPPAVDEEEPPDSLSPDRNTVLLTVGGGEDGERIVTGYLDMLRQFQKNVSFDSIVLPGPLLSDEAVGRFREMGRGLPVTIRHFVPDVGQLMRRASLTISMGGYNAVTEILTHARRALLIPRETPRLEQTLRAERLATLRLVTVHRQSQLDGCSLYDAVTQALDSESSSLEEARQESMLPLDGGEHLARELIGMLRHRATREDSAERRIDAAPRSDDQTPAAFAHAVQAKPGEEQ